MSKPLNTLDHNLYLTTYDGNTFAGQGEPDADFILAEFVNDTVTSVEGAKGEVQDTVRVAKMGRITFTCQWGSDFNKFMNQVYKDQQEGNYLQSADIKRISNTENVTVATSINPKIVKLPNWAAGPQATDRAYILNVHNMEMAEREIPS
jgi:hypothetical protein